jgi:LEA14-like dessication related protein
MRAKRLLLVLLLAGCAGLSHRMEPLDVTLSDIVPGEVGVLEQQYLLKLRVQNPNDVDIPVTGLAYQIELNDKPFAKGVSNQSVTVPRFGEVVLDVTAVSNITNVLQQIMQLQQGAPDAFRYRIKGRLASSGGSSIPFDQAGEFKLSSTVEGKK